MPESVYIETTIPSYLSAFPSVRTLESFRQRETQEWWIFRRPSYELYTSEVVWDECLKGDPLMVAERRNLLDGITELKVTPEAEMLAKAFVDSGVVPLKARTDAMHIAISAVQYIDLLLTWNCTHIANPHIQTRLRQVAQKHGYNLPTLCTPEALNHASDNLP